MAEDLHPPVIAVVAVVVITLVGAEVAVAAEAEAVVVGAVEVVVADSVLPAIQIIEVCWLFTIMFLYFSV